MPDILHVAVAVLVDEDGRSLLMQRLPGTHMAGYWEFPGGKLETGEDVHAALRRELTEELDVMPTTMRPLIRVQHAYPDREVLLDCWRIDDWSGTARAREGHALAWCTPAELPAYDLLEADKPVIEALSLPVRYAITGPGDADTILDGVRGLLEADHTLLQLRAPWLEAGRFDALARRAHALCRERGARLLVNAAPGYADGIHLTSAGLMAAKSRPSPGGMLVAASCHDADEVAHAARIGCDFIVLGPVRETSSHPGAEPLGWVRFAELADRAGLPVYALGGVGDDDLDTAWAHHGQGVAGITAWWRTVRRYN